MKSLVLSLSLLASAAAPAVAHEVYPGSQEVYPSYPAYPASRAERLGGQLDRLNTVEDTDLDRHDAWLDGVERRELEEQLWRQGASESQARFELARLYQKQRIRHAENVARLEAKQRFRDRADRADLARPRRFAWWR